MPSLKKLVITGAPFTKKAQEALAKMMPHTQILNCYGKMNQTVKSKKLFDNPDAVIKKFHRRSIVNITNI